MDLKLFHYVHCPFCVRVRMALGFLNMPYSSSVLSYDDENTPVELTGKKMLPILLIDGKAYNESLDIIAKLDTNNKLLSKEILHSEQYKGFEVYLNHLGSNIHNLTMPYWIYTPEFNENSRNYFKQKKEIKRGPFNLLVKQRSKFESELMDELEKLESSLNPFYQSENLTVYDIILASHLWGLYIVPEFRFKSKIHSYLQSIKELCKFNYHEDFWN